MARKTIVTLVDDLTGEAAEDISTVEFAVDGITYELDLTDDNSAKLRDALAPYARAGRKISGRRRGGTRPGHIRSTGGGAGYNRETLKSIRAWARNNGHSVSDRGRLSAEVLQAWQTAQVGMTHA
ncbi:MAG: Lsr2 family protein [Pseudonocardiaceae bacterium]